MSAELEESWEEVLERLEHQLEAYRACLVGGDVPEAYHLPKHLGPMPSALASRARALLELNRGIEAALEARKARLAAAMAGRSHVPWPARDPAFLDTRV